MTMIVFGLIVQTILRNGESDMGGKIDLTGQRFGRLVVLSESGRSKCRDVMWLCKCDCGASVTVSGNSLRRGRTKSCGCLNRERAAERAAELNKKHGMSNTRLFNIWVGILKRTGIHKGANEKTKRTYQERCIAICNEWIVFENFRDWASSNEYRDDLQIDRIDNDKGYCPENCRWVTRKENVNNRRGTLRLSDGTPLAIFCSMVGIETRGENGRISKQYHRIVDAYSKYHKIHPELLQKANDTILMYQKCVKLRKLIDEVKQLKQTLRQGLKN